MADASALETLWREAFAALLEGRAVRGDRGRAGALWARAREAGDGAARVTLFAALEQRARCEAPARVGGLGPLRPLPARAPLETPLHAVLASSLTAALAPASATASSAEHVLRMGLAPDLRLLTPWLDALRDDTLGELAALAALPAFGDAAREALAARWPEPPEEPALRTRVLLARAALAEYSLAPLLRRARRSGSPLERAGALRAEALLWPSRAERRALALLRAPRASVLERRTAAAVLAGSVRARAVRALLEALGAEPSVRSAALDALVRSRARARERCLLEALARGPAEPQGALRWMGVVRALGRLLAERPRRGLRRAMLAQLAGPLTTQARLCVLEALAAAPGREGRRAFAALLLDDDDECASAAARALLLEDPRVSAWLAPARLALPGGEARARVLLAELVRTGLVPRAPTARRLARRALALLEHETLGALAPVPRTRSAPRAPNWSSELTIGPRGARRCCSRRPRRPAITARLRGCSRCSTTHRSRRYAGFCSRR